MTSDCYKTLLDDQDGDSKPKPAMKKKFNKKKPTKIVYETEAERNTSNKKKEHVKHFSKMNSFNKKLTF